MTKKRLGRVQFTGDDGNKFIAARLNKDRLHLVQKNDSFNNSPCNVCRAPINVGFGEKVPIYYLYGKICSGTMVFPFTLYFHKECAEISEIPFE